MPQRQPTARSPDVQNLLLRRLSTDDMERVLEKAQRVELPFKTVVIEPNKPLRHVHFVESGTISMISTLEDGNRAEVGLVGFEGMAGLPLLFGAPTSPLEGLVQVEGSAYRLTAANFREALAEVPALLAVALRYVDSFHSQVVQTAVCNGRHRIEERLARWLLMTHDRVVGDDFPMTQEFMSTMLGVQRPGVTLAVGTLQRSGVLSHRGGRFTVVDRPGLEAVACECYAHAVRRFDWLVKPNSK
jgi:CRP-like cAMP-binding protein